MKKKLSLLFALVLAVSLMIIPAGMVGAAEEADTVYLNGNIYTVDDAFSTASAMAIKGDSFIYVGSDAGVQDYIGPGTAVIDLNGKTVVPGLMDSHIHFESVGQNILFPMVECWRTPLDELLSKIEARADEVGPGEWIIGWGYDETFWDPPVAYKELLDAVSPDNPVFMYRVCWHAGWANSKAMELAGIDAGGIPTPDPEGGVIVRDAAGNPTGVFVEKAKNLITGIMEWPSPNEQELRDAMVVGSEAALAAGLTVVHDASRTGMEQVNRMKDLYEAGLLKVRVNDMLRPSTAIELGEAQFGLYDNHYFLISTKVISDGSIGSRSAAMIEEYSDDPGNFGLLLIEEDPFALEVAELLDLGFSMRTHAIGDLANRVVINAYEKALALTEIAGEDARLVLEHAQHLDPVDLLRIAPLGIVCSMQEGDCITGMLAPPYLQSTTELRVGPERMLGYAAWGPLLDTGVVIASGTDYDVFPYYPFYGMHAAVTRQNQLNMPPDGVNAELAMTREEALRSRTMGNAYAMFAEDILGSIEAEKLADFVVIDRDYMTIPAEDIWRIEVLMTVVGGEIACTPIVDIDIKPGSDPNSINLKSKGVVPVAVLTTDWFKASDIDPDSVLFANAGPVRWTLEDVDGDGDMDMLFHFRTKDLDLTRTSTEATLTGTTYAGPVIQGTDTVNIVPTKD